MSEFDMRDIQKSFYEDGNISPQEADLIFQVNNAAKVYPEEWPNVFVGAITDYLLRQQYPIDVIDESKAVWLSTRISEDGVVEGDTEMALMLNILRYAESIPPRLEKFVLDQVKMAVVDGLGALARNPEYERNVIDAQEVEVVRLALYGSGGQGGTGITREEAEFVFELNEATHGAKNHPNWTDLFVGVLGFHLMATFGMYKESHEEIMDRKKWLQDSTSIPFNISTILKGFKAWYELHTEDRTPEWNKDAVIQHAEKITNDEAGWLIERLNRDGILDDNEKALLRFVKENASGIDPKLEQLILKAA